MFWLLPLCVLFKKNSMQTDGGVDKHLFVKIFTSSRICSHTDIGGLTPIKPINERTNKILYMLYC